MTLPQLSDSEPRYFVDIRHNAASGWWEWELRKGEHNQAATLYSGPSMPPTTGTAWTRGRALRKARRALRRYQKADRADTYERVQIA